MCGGKALGTTWEDNLKDVAGPKCWLVLEELETKLQI